MNTTDILTNVIDLDLELAQMQQGFTHTLVEENILTKLEENL